MSRIERYKKFAPRTILPPSHGTAQSCVGLDHSRCPRNISSQPFLDEGDLIRRLESSRAEGSIRSSGQNRDFGIIFLFDDCTAQ